MFDTKRPRRSSGYGMLAAGAVGGLLVGRFLPVLLANLTGAFGGALGQDPFANLIAEHRELLSLLDQMESTPVVRRLKRVTLFLQFKRLIGKHALAEEDIIYPMLQTDAEREEAAQKLYKEHAGMKISLFELERSIGEDDGWRLRVQDLRNEIAPHAQQEEEVEFPQLRKIMNDQESAELGRKLHREESLLV